MQVKNQISFIWLFENIKKSTSIYYISCQIQMKSLGRKQYTQTIVIMSRIKQALFREEIHRALKDLLLNSHLRFKKYIGRRKKIIMSRYTPKRKITMRLNKLEIINIAVLFLPWNRRKVPFLISLFWKIHNISKQRKRRV